jgi:hypothetical protein
MKSKITSTGSNEISFGFKSSTSGTTPISASEAKAIAADAYVFGYPLVLVDVTQQMSTAVSQPSSAAIRAPINQFVHAREFPDYTFTQVVTPNADTLYSVAWLDLYKEPMVLSVPDTGRRYYLMQLMDAWTDVFASPGTRTTGNRKANFALVGPRWNGTVPTGVKTIRAPTDLVLVGGRTQTNGKKDFAAVHAIQDHYKLTPLSAWGRSYTPPVVHTDASVDTKTPPSEQVARMSSATFFGRLNSLMRSNPPSPDDAPALRSFAAIGIGPGRDIDFGALDAALAEGLAAGAKAGHAAVVAAGRNPGRAAVNGWSTFASNVASFGTDYRARAAVALVGLGANLPQDAVYPHATTDSRGEPLHGSHRYAIRFAKGTLPPVKAFWSISMYNDKQAFVQNPLDRYAIGDRDELQADSDGSITIHVQHDSPGRYDESNWLPAPNDSFNLFMRLYWPDPSILDGRWKMPPVERVA